MNKKMFLVVAVLALALSACGALPAASGGSVEQPRTLTVTGNAQIPLTPDIAYIQIGVHTEAETVANAVENNNIQVEAVKAALLNLGVAEQDLQTTNFSIYQMDQWSPDGTSFGKVYSVDNTVYVTIRDLARMGDLLQAAVQAGANNIYGIQFDVADKSAALVEGRRLAVAAAAAQAQELAGVTGVTLGDIRTISYYSGSYATPFYGYGGGGGGGAEQVSISAGQLLISVDVSVVYDIQP